MGNFKLFDKCYFSHKEKQTMQILRSVYSAQDLFFPPAANHFFPPPPPIFLPKAKWKIVNG